MTDDDGPDGVIDALIELLSRLDEHGGEQFRSGGWSDGTRRIDYGVSVRGLDDAIGSGPTDDAPDDPAIATRETEAGITVVADLTGIETDDPEVDFDRSSSTLTIRSDGAHLGAVTLSEGEWRVADVSLNNRVLAVELHHD